MTDLARLALNTATTKQWTLQQAIDGALRTGIRGLGVWRDRVAEVGAVRAGRLLAEAGLAVTSLCRGGFLTADDADGVRHCLADNRSAIEEAAAVGTSELVLVVGGLPPGDRDLAGARIRVADRIADLVPFAADHGVRLVLEPLHPMYCADRAVLSTVAQALDLADPFPAETVGIVIDTFHVWWDPRLPEQIERAAAAGRLALYQVNDFLLPIAADALLSRGVMGDGCIDVADISSRITAAGYTGPVEVEIFNADLWQQDGAEVVRTVIDRYRRLVLPFLEGS